jgi:hypothetical protein
MDVIAQYLPHHRTYFSRAYIQPDNNVVICLHLALLEFTGRIILPDGVDDYTPGIRQIDGGKSSPSRLLIESTQQGS